MPSKLGKKVKTRDRIIQASIELFNQYGERATTTNHIAAHLGMSPGNLYYHFRNKNDIIEHIFEEYKSQLINMVPPIEQAEDTLGYLKQTFDGIFALVWRFSFFYSNSRSITFEFMAEICIFFIYIYVLDSQDLIMLQI